MSKLHYKTIVCKLPANNKQYHFYAHKDMAVVKGQSGYVKCRNSRPGPRTVIVHAKVLDVIPYRTNKANMPFLGAIAQDLEHAYYCAEHTPASKSLVLNLHREPARTVPVTEAQLKLIRKLEKETGFTFEGRWMIDACEFIDECEKHLEQKADLIWAALAPNNDGAVFINPTFNNYFTLPEERGFPPTD